MSKSIRRIGVVGTGVIGASWSVLFLAQGYDAVATDPAQDAEKTLREYIVNAWPAVETLNVVVPEGSQSRLTFTIDINRLADVDFVQENGPERLAFKRELYQQLDAVLRSDVIIATSSSGLAMTDIQEGCERHPERCLVGHPFNPPI
jgi:carnitine 3-dehydrogenase